MAYYVDAPTARPSGNTRSNATSFMGGGSILNGARGRTTGRPDTGGSGSVLYGFRKGGGGSSLRGRSSGKKINTKSTGGGY